MVNLPIIGEFVALCHDFNSSNQALLITRFIFIMVIKRSFDFILRHTDLPPI